MLYQYRFKNLWSFATTAEVSFLLGRDTPNTATTFKTPRGTRLSKLVSVWGANGAGKTNALKAPIFLSWFISRSFAGDRWVPMVIRPHFSSKDESSEIEMEFECDDERYRYRLVATAEHVVHESLHKKSGTSFSYLFHRDLTASGSYTFRQKGFELLKGQARRVGAKVSMISAAAHHKVPRARRLADYFGRISTNLDIFEGHLSAVEDLSENALFFYEHPDLRRTMAKFMRRADLGLSDIKIEKVGGKASAFGVHLRGRKPLKVPIVDESRRTQTLFMLLRKILPVLERGGIAVLDELDAGLHPDLVTALLGLFADVESNPYHAQIIFTSHTPDVMDAALKEQLLLVEKDLTGHSQTLRLDKIEGVGRDEDYYAKYRAGTYGGVPDV